ncbi:MAG: EAL domain-containing protein [Pseudomonadota bacterium]
MTDGCVACREGRAFAPEFSFAFQPIVDGPAGKVFAYEALVRGPNGEPANTVLDLVTNDDLYAFDQKARKTAVALAARLFPAGDDGPKLSINVFPNAVYDPVRCLRTTLRAAQVSGFSLRRLMFEITEHERIVDTDKLQAIVNHYAACGFTVALDDFGAGFAGLGLLAEFKPNFLKIDMAIVRDVDLDETRRAIVAGILTTASALGIDVVAEGVETVSEYHALSELGVRYFQGYLLARPAFEALPPLHLPAPVTVAPDAHAA